MISPRACGKMQPTRYPRRGAGARQPSRNRPTARSIRSRSSSSAFATLPPRIGAQRTVDQRVLELLGKEVRIHRTDLSVLHGIGEHVGDQPARVKLVVAIGARQLRELMRLG